MHVFKLKLLLLVSGVAPITKNKTKKANDSAKSNVIVSEYNRINSKK